MTDSKALPDLRDVRAGNLSLKLTRDSEDIKKAQKLRYRIFFQEHNLDEKVPDAIDEDKFDYRCDHLLVIDNSITSEEDKVVGTYRLLRRDNIEKDGYFYTETEFNISTLLKNSDNVMELGRSCVAEEYRTGAAIQLLWRGIAKYAESFNIQYLFGCASLPGTDVKKHELVLSYLVHNHKADEDICPSPLESMKAKFNLIPKEEIDNKKVRMQLPPLLKGYLALGGVISDGAVIDEEFNSIDVCIIVDTKRVSKRYAKRFESKEDV